MRSVIYERVRQHRIKMCFTAKLSASNIIQNIFSVTHYITGILEIKVWCCRNNVDCLNFC